jgi:hypothetical protein
MKLKVGAIYLDDKGDICEITHGYWIQTDYWLVFKEGYFLSRSVHIYDINTWFYIGEL